MSCNNCNCICNENTHEEFVPLKEYPVGSFFKVDKEVFKVVKDDCSHCDYGGFYGCNLVSCDMYERNDNTEVSFILYDTIE